MSWKTAISCCFGHTPEASRPGLTARLELEDRFGYLWPVHKARPALINNLLRPCHRAGPPEFEPSISDQRGVTMRDYEIVYIFDSSLDRTVIDEKLERFNELATGQGGGSEVTAVEHWGKRQLAYPIRKHDNGYYVVVQFRAEATSLPEFERAIKLDEQVLRYLVVLSEGELPTPRSAAEEIKPRFHARHDDRDED